MHGRPIRTSLGSEPHGSALVCAGSTTFNKGGSRCNHANSLGVA